MYKHLSEEEIEKLTLKFQVLKKLIHMLKKKLLKNFINIALAQDYISQGGIGYAKTVLEKALGKNKHNRLLIDLHLLYKFDHLILLEKQILLKF